MSWDGIQRQGFLAVNDLSADTPALHGVLRGYAMYGVVLFAVLLLAGWWFARGRGPVTMASALWAPLGMLLAIAVNQPLGRLVHEARPYAVLPHVLVLVPRSHDFSFPSDHSVMAGAVAAGVWLVSRRLGLVALAAALLMAFARVYVGAHFPLDVVAGLLVGAVVVLVGHRLLLPVLRALVVRLERTPLRPLLAARPTP
ncbi:phosphatase PAP2 family protein [Nocardioides panaciterrulae]|uniref:Undecaprenyl-diphosphatase n=1 Tax=Nocardioides panaciterrulae TaxID=661492 RepID=A0A7Y9E8C5_9ACTN|nr:phosphatase PAP2 family protein [Nocardioides panaciterrulae]NYD42989.1 undecaprenyl-diphosphatase [Nocardioides panaciterrulae]